MRMFVDIVSALRARSSIPARHQRIRVRHSRSSKVLAERPRHRRQCESSRLQLSTHHEFHYPTSNPTKPTATYVTTARADRLVPTSVDEVRARLEAAMASYIVNEPRSHRFTFPAADQMSRDRVSRHARCTEGQHDQNRSLDALRLRWSCSARAAPVRRRRTIGGMNRAASRPTLARLVARRPTTKLTPTILAIRTKA